MKRIEFSDMTYRLRRNLMATAAILIAIVYFDIKVGRIAAQGIEIKGLTIEIIISILISVLFYHLIAFGIRAFEEYRHWELTFTDEQATAYGGGLSVIDISKRLFDAVDILEKITKNDDLLGAEGQEVLSDSDICKLKGIGNSTEKYAKRFQNFPIVTRWRFWVWDVGIAVIIAVSAISFAVC